MNILIDIVPSTIEIDGTIYTVNSNFRTWILFEQLLQDDNVPGEIKTDAALELIFPEKKPPLTEKTVNRIMWFYCCGQTDEDEESEKEEPDEAESEDIETYNVYDWDYDADYIYAAFLQQYRIDLQSIEQLHWWKFKALFKSLSDDTEFVKILGYRSVKITADMTSQQKNFYRRMHKLYDLPVPKTELEKTKELEKRLMAGELIDDLL